MSAVLDGLRCDCGQPALTNVGRRICGDCQRQYARQWRAAHPERLAAYALKRLPPRCYRCGKHKPAGSTSTYCPPCYRDWRREKSWVPGRRCCACQVKLLPGRVSNYCQDCDRQARLARANKPDRPCSGGCGALLKPGVQHNLCPACSRRERERIKQRQRDCSWCGEPVPKGMSGYLCRLCESIRGVEQRAAAQTRRQS